MRRSVVLGVIMLVLVAGCSEWSQSPRSDDPWDQSWYLISMETTDGLVLRTSTPNPVSVHFTSGVGGSDGCDLFATSYEYDDPYLSFGAIRYQYANSTQAPAECPDEYLPVVEGVRGAPADGVTVTEMTRDTMVWWWDEGSVIFFFAAGIEGSPLPTAARAPSVVPAFSRVDGSRRSMGVV